jgi:penicillin amidase
MKLRAIRLSVALLALLLPALPLGAVAATSADAPPAGTVLKVDGASATIVRDAFGVPHIYALTNRALFVAYGYAVAQDRLWQLELNRRAARGRLAEVFGPSVVPADTVARTVGYTESELDAQFARLGSEEKEIFRAYADGINRYLTEVVAVDPLHALPFEFHALGVNPEPWTLRDSVAFGAFMTRRFGEIGGRHLTNQSLLDHLVKRFGDAAGYAAFNDVRWRNDPDAPVTVPVAEGQTGQRETSGQVAAQLEGVAADLPAGGDEATQIWERLGVVTKLGSYAWVVSPWRSANRAAMLYGGPQMGFSAPEVLHEVQLTGGNGFNVTGMAFAGVPAVLIGRNARVAWTSTTATGGNVDTYLETLCGVDRYVFRGQCTAMESRVESIKVRGATAIVLPVRRTVHGPVVGGSGPVAVSQKRAHWQREIESISSFIAFDRARDLAGFEAGVKTIVTSHNFLYADQRGNIAYWQAGQVPVRPAGFDPRLPFPGDGRAEWPGGILPMPKSINPKQGYLANWNNKPSVDYDNADSQIFGKQFRLLDLQARLARGVISLEDMRDIPKDIARFGGLGRESRYLLPYLLEGIEAVPPSHSLAERAVDLLEGWDGNNIRDAVTSTRLEPGEVIFASWLSHMIRRTFLDALGPSKINEASSNMLLHVLDAALGDGSGVPPSRDYFNGGDPRAAISQAFDAALAELQASRGDDPSGWRPLRGTTTFRHPVIGPVGSIPESNRATYAQIVVLSRPEISSENIFTLGQSGFVGLSPTGGFVLDPHFRDQLELYRNFQYKPMRLAPADTDD